MTALDYSVIVIYLLTVALLGIYAAGRQQSNADYFLGGHRLPWWAVLFSVVATETSTLTFISIPAVAYTGDLTFLQLAIGYIAGRILVSFYFLPAYHRGELSTAYQFLARRFGESMRNITSATFLVTRFLADGVRLFATAIPLAIILRLGGLFTEWSDLHVYMLAICAIAGITILYTFIGGIRAVVWMDVIQMSVYVGGALLAVAIMSGGLDGGVSGALASASQQGKTTFIDFGFDRSFGEFIANPYLFLVAVIGGGVFSVASHGTDQLIVQRLLSTRNLRHSQWALIGSGVVAFLQFGLFLGIGLLLHGFYSGQTPEELGLASPDEIFALFIIEELPAGLSGLIVAALIAAAMSSLSSSLNSLASSTAMDLYNPYFGRHHTARQNLYVSRVISVAWGLVLTGAAFGFAVLQLRAEDQPAVVELGLEIASYTYGGLLGAFVLGLLFKRPDRTDAMIGFFTGLVAMLYMVEGPVQDVLPGTPLPVAWPLYPLIGSAVVVAAGHLSMLLRRIPPGARGLLLAAWLSAAATLTACEQPKSMTTELDQHINDHLDTTATTGAVSLIARGDEVLHHRAYGHAERYRLGDDGELHTVEHPEPMETGHLFDLASLTKVYATTLAVMYLVDEGRLELDDPLDRHMEGLPAEKQPLTVRQLLSHTSGMRAWMPVYLQAAGPQQARDVVLDEPLGEVPGTQHTYSDLGYMTAGHLIEEVTGLALDEFLARYLYGPMGLRHTAFNPLDRGLEPLAATSHGNPFERRMIEDPEFGYRVQGDAGDFTRWRDYTLKGEVNDGNAWYAHRGVAGHAGLFSTSEDLLAISRMLLQGGRHEGRQILASETATQFLPESFGAAAEPDSDALEGQHLPGWSADPGHFHARRAPDGTVGHTGFTGTGAVLIPEHDAVVILLTNRQHGNRQGSYPDLRPLREEVTGVALQYLQSSEAAELTCNSRYWVISSISSMIPSIHSLVCSLGSTERQMPPGL